ncbi:MAG: alpha/beta hydrolase [Bacteroidetes bacterium]|nr:alpha/beta hydrolase [Bacteroidota bacterium]
MRKVINSLVVNDEGKENAQSIIFVHGFPFGKWMWEKQVKVLQKRYRCITYDMRGLGESYVGDGQYTMEAYVYDLYSIIDKLKLEKPVLCGLSMGGYVSLRAVEKEHDKFGGLILCDTKADGDDDNGKLVRAAKINQINTEGLDQFIDGFVVPLFSEDAPKQKKKLVSDVLLKAKKNNPVGVKGALIAMLSRTDTNKMLKKIKIPTLVIAGSFDKLTPPVKMRDMAAKIPNSDFAIVPRAGHLTPLENPGGFNDLLIGYMKKYFD